MRFKRRINMDFASATPTLKSVASYVEKIMVKYGANPSSLYSEGREAKKFLESAREQVASELGGRSSQIVFLSGGTEANNLAIRGVVEKFRVSNPNTTPHVITSSIEHSSVLEVVHSLQSNGVEVTYIKPEANGVIDARKVRDAISSNTVLITIMYANNEIGTVMPLKEVVKWARSARNENNSIYPLIHTDASQAPLYLDINVNRLGVDFLTIDGAKFYGPKGVGALFVKSMDYISPIIFGGGQEGGLRSGTENVALIGGFAKALSIAGELKIKEALRLNALRKYFIESVLKIDGVSLNGDIEASLPNIVSICVSGLDAEFAVFQFDELGIAVSSASTCMNLKEDSYSYVVDEIRPGRGCKGSSLRFSFGRSTRRRDIDICVKALRKVILKRLDTNPLILANDTNGSSK